MIELDGGFLASAQIAALAGRRDGFAVSDAAWRRIGRSRAVALRVAGERAVYGRSTGVGANRSVGIGPGGGDAHALALLRSHAGQAGAPRSPERVRAMLAVRLNQLAAGGSGVAPQVVAGLAAMLAADALPQVRQFAGVGTGDLAALAATALALAGERATKPPLPGVTPFGPHDALPFISSNAAALGDAALACVRLGRLARAAVVVAALTFAAGRGNAEAFAEVVDRVTPFPGARRVAGWMRVLIEGAGPAARIQDPFGLRTLPQTLGPALDALEALDAVVGRLAGAPSENPVVWGGALDGAGGGDGDGSDSGDGTDSGDSRGSGDGGVLAHHGGFHAAYLTLALDGALIAVVQAAKLVLARLTALNDPAFTGLPAFLGAAAAGASGTMILEYVAAGALGRLRAAAVPAGLQTVVLSHGVEEDASFASLAAQQALEAVDPLRTLLACELVAAVRALRLGGLVPASGPLCRALECCAGLPAQLADRDLSGDIEIAEVALEQLAGLLD